MSWDHHIVIPKIQLILRANLHKQKNSCTAQCWLRQPVHIYLETVSTLFRIRTQKSLQIPHSKTLNNSVHRWNNSSETKVPTLKPIWNWRGFFFYYFFFSGGCSFGHRFWGVLSNLDSGYPGPFSWTDWPVKILEVWFRHDLFLKIDRKYKRFRGRSWSLVP